MVLAVLGSDRANAFSWARSVGLGAASFVIGYLVIFRANDGVYPHVVGALTGFQQAGLPTPEYVDVGAWVFFAAHNVGAGVDSLSSDFAVPVEKTPLWEPTFLVIPVALLLAAGVLAAWLGNATSPLEGAWLGASVVVGYFPLAVGAGFASTHTAETTVGTASAGPNLLWAALIAGIAYPVVVGGVGGAVTARFASPK